MSFSVSVISEAERVESWRGKQTEGERKLKTNDDQRQQDKQYNTYNQSHLLWRTMELQEQSSKNKQQT